MEVLEGTLRLLLRVPCLYYPHLPFLSSAPVTRVIIHSALSPAEDRQPKCFFKGEHRKHGTLLAPRPCSVPATCPRRTLFMDFLLLNLDICIRYKVRELMEFSRSLVSQNTCMGCRFKAGTP